MVALSRCVSLSSLKNGQAGIRILVFHAAQLQLKIAPTHTPCSWGIRSLHVDISSSKCIQTWLGPVAIWHTPKHLNMAENAAAKSPSPPLPSLTNNGPALSLRAKLSPLRASKEAGTATPIPTPKLATRPTETWKARLSPITTYLTSFTSRAAARLTTPARAVAKVAGITGFAVACVALWSTLVTMDDGHHAVTLAEWTARKDFLEYCREVRDTSVGMNVVPPD